MPHTHWCESCRRSWRCPRLRCPDARVEDDGLRTWIVSAPVPCRDCAEAR